MKSSVYDIIYRNDNNVRKMLEENLLFSETGFIAFKDADGKILYFYKKAGILVQDSRASTGHMGYGMHFQKTESLGSASRNVTVDCQQRSTQRIFLADYAGSVPVMTGGLTGSYGKLQETLLHYMMLQSEW